MCQPNGRGFSYLTVCLALLLSPALAQAGSVVPTDDANTLANALLRPNSGLTLVSASLSGPAGATATPSLGTGGSGDGILLTTGLASEAVGPPTLTASTDLGDRL